MKTRLFNHYEAETQTARDLIDVSGLDRVLANIVDNCIKHNLSLRDANMIVQQEVSITFAHYLMRDACKRYRAEKQNSVQSQAVTITVTKLLTEAQV